MPEIQKSKKQGKGIVFSDLIYVRNPVKKTDSKGKRYQSFYFIIDNNMGFGNCTYYGSVELKDRMCLKCLKGRWCPNTVNGRTYQNIKVEGFEIYEPQKPQNTGVTVADIEKQEQNPFGMPSDNKILPENKTESLDELAWINEEPKPEKKSDENELFDVKDINFNE